MRTVPGLAATAMLWFGFAVVLGHIGFTPGMTAGLVHLSSYLGFNGDEAVENFFMISSAAVALLLAVGVVCFGNRAIRRRMTTA